MQMRSLRFRWKCTEAHPFPFRQKWSPKESSVYSEQTGGPTLPLLVVSLPLSSGEGRGSGPTHGSGSAQALSRLSGGAEGPHGSRQCTLES